MLNLIAWIIVGGIAGWVASLIMKTDREMGCLSNVIVGMLGSLIGGALIILLNTGRLDLFNTSFNDLNIVSVLVSIIGAVILIAILKMLRRPTAAP